jgi:hypothetical protein
MLLELQHDASYVTTFANLLRREDIVQGAVGLGNKKPRTHRVEQSLVSCLFPLKSPTLLSTMLCNTTSAASYAEFTVYTVLTIAYQRWRYMVDIREVLTY